MILLLFGQPCSGKTTLAKGILEFLNPQYTEHIDGDRLRDIFANKDFSKEGRVKNLNRASDIAHYLNSNNTDVVLSLVYPYQEARDYLNSLTAEVKWVYLTYKEEKGQERGREQFHVKDFEYPAHDNILWLNTTWLTEEECIKQIKSYINNEIPSKGSL